MKRKRQPKSDTASALAHLSVSHGKRVRLSRLLYGSGLANGTLMVLPLDQGLEHGPTDFFPNPAALDPDYQFRLAALGRYSAIALGIGLAEKYLRDYCGKVPLILKLNGKTNIPDDDEAVSGAFASVEDAVRLGADAVGYTVYVGSPRQDLELREYRKVRQDCERLGMPLVMWAYPRGRGIDAKGGRGSTFAQDYAARVAEELGADLVKLHEPTAPNDRVPEPYRSLREDAAARVRRVVRSAGRTLVLFSGGEKDDRDERVLAKIRLYMNGGATGVMFGRNMWLRRFDDALDLTRRAQRELARHPR
jgi:class I fructose-bisphosphate aldolase